MKKSKNNIVIGEDFNRIIIPVDGSDGSQRAIRKALTLAKETGVNVLAIHVIQLPYSSYSEINYAYPDLPDLMEILKKEGQTILNDVKKMGAKKGVHIETKLVEGIPDDKIIKEAGKNDLIIMGCKGRTALSRILVGSVCDKVVHHSKSPVMVIR